MRTLSEVLSEFRQISENPKAQLAHYLSQGKKAVGCMPYFCPEELVHAAGMVPFGLWGAETPVSEAKRYLPAFICSIIQTTLELGLRGEYKGLSAVMIPILCDSLKGMEGNWRYGVKDIPVIHVAHAQNRKIPAGAEFTASQYRKIKTSLEDIAGNSVSDADIASSNAVYNKRNSTVRRFIEELAARPGVIKPSERSAVFKTSYFMDAAEYTAKVEELCDILAAAPNTNSTGPRLVTCGIIADNTGLLKILDECGVCVIDDVVTHESLRFRFDTPESGEATEKSGESAGTAGDPIMALALQIGTIEGCSVLYDLGKKRAEMLVNTALQSNADGVLLVMTKFCDPEEYDIVPLRRILEKNGIRCIQVEVDQQTTSLEQVKIAIETFCEILAN